MICETFDNAEEMYFRMVRDISAARQRVFLEMYIYVPDRFGTMLRNAFTDAARRGVEVKILLDSWGTRIKPEFFRDIVCSGAEVRYFNQLQLSPKMIRYHHNRNHRKLLIIDDAVFYIGSANISEKEATWRQLSARIEDDNRGLAAAFLDDFHLHNRLFCSVRKRIKPIIGTDYVILRDVPSHRHQQVRGEILRMILTAKKRVYLESPYFIPDRRLSAALRLAAGKGRHVTIIIPKKSDVRMVDLLVNSYLHKFHRAGIHIFLCNAGTLHAKCILADDKVMFGTANFNYRSFTHQYEMMLVSRNPYLVGRVIEHLEGSLIASEPFDYLKWKNSPAINIFIGRALRPFRQFI